jgi:DNA-binding response OmpR family regulator
MALRILVVEDDDSLLELYQQLLQGEGYEVSLSSTPFEDVTDVERLHPDLVLLDVKISGPDDDLTLLEQLRSYPATHCLPILLCTAAAASQVRERVEGLQQQGVPVVYKPFEIEELFHTIRLALRSAEEAEVA